MIYGLKKGITVLLNIFRFKATALQHGKQESFASTRIRPYTMREAFELERGLPEINSPAELLTEEVFPQLAMAMSNLPERDVIASLQMLGVEMDRAPNLDLHCRQRTINWINVRSWTPHG